MNPLAPADFLPLVDLALREDVGPGDATSLAVVPEAVVWSAQMVAREPLVVSGLPIAAAVFRKLDPSSQIVSPVSEGESVAAGTVLMTLRGRAQILLSAERVALNFVQRLSGIATLTQQYVKVVAGLNCQILDTRKTTPGWRTLEKYAVACGGATNHRMGLYDLIMIKDNHLAVLAEDASDPIATAVTRAREAYPDLRVEVEADSVEQAAAAADAGADIVLLDNMNLGALREAVARIAGRSKTEASGGVRLETLRAIAETGVDFVSVGALTHSATSVDIALDIEPGQRHDQ